MRAHEALVSDVLRAPIFLPAPLRYGMRDPAIGVFRSRYTASELLANAADRAERWRTAPLTTLRHYSREDQYMSEGLWHVQARNEAGNDPLTQFTFTDEYDEFGQMVVAIWSVNDRYMGGHLKLTQLFRVEHLDFEAVHTSLHHPERWNYVTHAAAAEIHFRHQQDRKSVV